MGKSYDWHSLEPKITKFREEGLTQAEIGRMLDIQFSTLANHIYMMDNRPKLTNTNSAANQYLRQQRQWVDSLPPDHPVQIILATQQPETTP